MITLTRGEETRLAARIVPLPRKAPSQPAAPQQSTSRVRKPRLKAFPDQKSSISSATGESIWYFPSPADRLPRLRA